MTRGAMMMISAAAAGILIAGTAAAISVVNATETAPTSNTVELIGNASPPAATTPATQAVPAPVVKDAGAAQIAPLAPQLPAADQANPLRRPDDRDGDDD